MGLAFRWVVAEFFAHLNPTLKTSEMILRSVDGPTSLTCAEPGTFLFHAGDALVKSSADILTVEDINRRCSTVITDAIARKWFSTANKNAGKLWLSLAQSCRAGDECFHAHARYHSLIERSQKQHRALATSAWK